MPAQIPAKTSGSLGEALTNTRTAVTNELSAVHLERLKSLAIEISTEIGETAAPAPGSILDRLDDLEAGGGGVPDPSAEDDGQILTVASGAAVWANPPSGTLPDPSGEGDGKVLTTAGGSAAWAAPPSGAADTILSVTSTDGDTNALVTPQNDGVSLSLVGAGSNGVGGTSGPAVLQGGRGFGAADGGDVYVQGGTVAGAGQQGGVRIGDISGAYVAIGRGDGQSTTIAGDLQIYGNGAGGITIENGSGAIDFASSVTGLPNAIASGASGYMTGADKAKLDALSGVFGTQAQSSENLGAAFTTASSAQQVAHTWTTTSIPAGTYRIGWYMEIGATTATGLLWASMYLDGAIKASERFPLAGIDTVNAYFDEFSGFMTETLTAGTHTIVLYIASSAAATVFALNRRLYLHRVS